MRLARATHPGDCGNQDLLVLHPFAGIPILSPAAFLHMLDIEK